MLGAMYPWQSGSNGREETQTLHLNPHSGRWIPDHTHRQRHINVPLPTTSGSTIRSPRTTSFSTYGAEMLLEIARFWASIAAYNSSIDRYEITGVMGPDEYHTAYPGADPEAAGGIHNNAYTNVMVAWVLERARDVLALLPPAHCRQLCERLGLTEADLAQWDELSRKLRVPLHGRHPQPVRRLRRLGAVRLARLPGATATSSAWIGSSKRSTTRRTATRCRNRPMS